MALSEGVLGLTGLWKPRRKPFMKRKTASRALVFLCLGLILLPCVIFAAPFAAKFQIAKIDGKCKVRVPTAEAFEDVVVSNRYVYGTVLQTSRGSSAIVRFSKGNGCLIHELTTITISENLKARNEKTLKLDSGGVKVLLEKNFHKNNKLSVQTPSAVCGAVGCDFTVTYKIVGDLRTTFLSCTEGEVRVDNSQRLLPDIFSITGIGANEQVSVAESPSGKFIRIKQVKGKTRIALVLGRASDKKLELVTGDEVVIMIKESKEQPDESVVLFKIEYADPEKELEVYEGHPVPQKEPKHPKEWPNITVTTPVPEQKSPTPVGKQ
jgi:hypothetical protein